MTTPLSPAAQEIDDAFWKTINDKWNIYDRRRSQLAAALRAAADQVVPKTPTLSYPEDYELGVWVANDDARTALLAIAAELEAH